LRSAGLAEDEIKRVIDPLKSFYRVLSASVRGGQFLGREDPRR
jgi:hypothetical protein